MSSPERGGSALRSELPQQAKGAVQGAAEQAQQKAGEATAGARARAREEIDRRTSAVGEQASSMADALRQTATQLRDQGQDGQARLADGAAQHVQRMGTYLRDRDADTLLRDIEDLGRRQPLAIAAGGLAVGLLAARFLKASSSGRYQAGQGRSSYAQWERQLPPRSQLETSAASSGRAPYGGSRDLSFDEPSFDEAAAAGTRSPASSAWE